MHEKAKFVCFNYMHPQKVKFKFVQINMKHVSYGHPGGDDQFYSLCIFHQLLTVNVAVYRLLLQTALDPGQD